MPPERPFALVWYWCRRGAWHNRIEPSALAAGTLPGRPLEDGLSPRPTADEGSHRPGYRDGRCAARVRKGTFAGSRSLTMVANARFGIDVSKAELVCALIDAAHRSPRAAMTMPRTEA